MIAAKQRRPPCRAAGIDTNPIRWRHNSSPSPLAQAKQRVTIFTLWRHFRFDGLVASVRI